MLSVVLPVHNGGHHLRVCLESIARQDAAPGSFELVVLDNASTDGSLEALHVLPDSVPRRVYPSDRFLTIEENWARIRDLTDLRPLMTMVGHDDAFDPEFIRTTVAAMQAEPQTQLLFTHFRLIDSQGELIRSCRPMRPFESPADFLASRFSGIRDSFGTGYVFRSDDYRRVGGIPLYAKLLWADDALWMSLARGSHTRILPNECFSYRLHLSSTQHVRDSGLILRAFNAYLSFLDQEAARDPEIARVMKSYGAEYLRGIASYWLLEDANGANRAGQAFPGELADGWRRVLARSCALLGKPVGADPAELAFSLWANATPVRRSLWKNRPVRRLLRLAHKRGLIQ